MKTIEEFYKEIAGSKELQEELKKLSDEALGEFLKKHNCEATAKELSDFVKSQTEGEIGDVDVEAATGGAFFPVMTSPKAKHKPQGVL